MDSASASPANTVPPAAATARSGRELVPALRLAARAGARLAIEYGRLLHAMTLPADDLQLAHRALHRDPDAIRLLGERLACVPRMLAARNARAGRPLGDDEIVDAAHDVIARVWSQLGEFRGQAALESWVYRFCEFELINAARRKRRRPASLDPDTIPEAATESRRFDMERVLQCLDRLPPEEESVVRAKHFAGLTFEEIALRDGAQLATVKSRYYRALEKLRFWLAPLRAGGEA
jgi:RNA polymerase sigma-70 factor (ECF subfamily)